MKLILSLAALAILSVSLTYSQSHHAIWGQIGWNDSLAHFEVVKKSSSFMQVVTKDVAFPPRGVPNYRRISAIRALDQYTNGKGGYATILAGGLNMTTVTLHFKSQRGNSFNFTMEVYVRN